MPDYKRVFPAGRAQEREDLGASDAHSVVLRSGREEGEVEGLRRSRSRASYLNPATMTANRRGEKLRKPSTSPTDPRKKSQAAKSPQSYRAEVTRDWTSCAAGGERSATTSRFLKLNC